MQVIAALQSIVFMSGRTDNNRLMFIQKIHGEFIVELAALDR
jgi:hypothetical protein